MGRAWEAPFTAGGSLQHYPERTFMRYDPVTSRNVYEDPYFRAPEPFEATLTIQPGVMAGRSAKYLMLAADDGRTFPMFVADLLDMALRAGVPTGGRITGRWVVRKRGQNFGIALAPRDAD